MYIFFDFHIITILSYTSISPI